MVSSILLLAALLGCGGDEPTAKDQPPQPEGTPQPVTTPQEPPPTLAMADLQAQAENIALVPSPAEMQKALEKAKVAGGISTLVTEREFKMDVENKDVVAVRTGVVLADALLTVKEAPKDALVGRLEKVKTGMNTLGAGTDIGATLDELIANVKNDVKSRDEFLKDLDDLHGAIIPEIKFEAGERAVPLLQAGSWLEGSNLVAAAIIKANQPEAGNSLLRQPQVASYFLKYVQVEGADKAPAEVLTQLETTLKKLGEIAAKPALTIEDVNEVKSQTDAVLALL